MKISAVSTITKSLPIEFFSLVNYSLLATFGYINLFCIKKHPCNPLKGIIYDEMLKWIQQNMFYTLYIDRRILRQAQNDKDKVIFTARKIVLYIIIWNTKKNTPLSSPHVMWWWNEFRKTSLYIIRKVRILRRAQNDRNKVIFTARNV